jgi:putative ABC transport system substrate-binding protein
LALGVSTQAQLREKVPRIGVLSATGDPYSPAEPQIEAFRKGLRELGYVEEKNILVEYRYAAGKQDRLVTLVDELVQLKVDVLVVTALTAIRAAKAATKTIPIVMVILSDPVGSGIVESLAWPGGNITGLTRLTRELSAKRLELLKETAPRISRAGIMFDADAPGAAAAFKDYKTAAKALKLQVKSLEVRGPNPDFETALRSAFKPPSGALVIINNALLRRHSKPITKLVTDTRIPSMYEAGAYVEAGGLMSYSADENEAYKRAATYVDKILKGVKPADLPIEQPTKFEFIINLKTAKQIGVTIPNSMLYRADKVIR